MSMNDLKEFIAGLLVMAFFAYGILYSLGKEEELVQKHCGHLTGAEYGQCQASIY